MADANSRMKVTLTWYVEEVGRPQEEQPFSDLHQTWNMKFENFTAFQNELVFETVVPKLKELNMTGLVGGKSTA